MPEQENLGFLAPVSTHQQEQEPENVAEDEVGEGPEHNQSGWPFPHHAQAINLQVSSTDSLSAPHRRVTAGRCLVRHQLWRLRHVFGTGTRRGSTTAGQSRTVAINKTRHPPARMQVGAVASESLLGGDEGIRTPDPLDANEVRYRTALHPQGLSKVSKGWRMFAHRFPPGRRRRTISRRRRVRRRPRRPPAWHADRTRRGPGRARPDR